MAVLRRVCDVVYSNGNQSILAVTSASSPRAVEITMDDLFAGLDAIFGNDTSRADSFNQDSQAANALILHEYWRIFVDAAGEPKADDALSVFRGLLTTPLLLFNDNWLNPYRVAIPDLIDLGLSRDFYVSVDLTRTVPHLIIPQWTVVLYTVTSLLIYLWCVGGIILSIGVVGPPTTPFDMLDFASRIAANRENGSLVELLAEMPFHNSKSFREKFQKKGIFVRELQPSGSSSLDYGRFHKHSEKSGMKVALTTDGASLTRLQRGRVYE